MRAKIGVLWLLAGLLVAGIAVGGCPKTQSTDTGPAAATPAPPAVDAAASETSGAAQPALNAPDNIGNAKNADGAYVCPVMGTVLTELNDELSVEHEGKIYYFCCAGCPEQFRADPQKYISQIETGEAAEETGSTEPVDSHEGHEHG